MSLQRHKMWISLIEHSEGCRAIVVAEEIECSWGLRQSFFFLLKWPQEFQLEFSTFCTFCVLFKNYKLLFGFYKINADFLIINHLRNVNQLPIKL